MTTAAMTPERLQSDLRTYAQLAQAHYEPSRVEPVIETIADIAPNALIAVRTTTEPIGERDVNVRFMHFATDPVERLRGAGLLSFTGHPIEQVLAAVTAATPVQYGVDVSAAGGIQKIWLALPQLLNVRDVVALPGIPEAARTHADHLIRWGGEQICLMALDFAHRTMNLYAQLMQPGQLPAEDVTASVAELGFVAPTTDELAALEAHSYTIYETFSWTDPGVRRICFPRRFTAQNFPVHLDPVLARFVEGAPLAGNGDHAFTFYAAYGPSGRYYKIQADYNPRGDDIRLPGNNSVPPSH